MLKVSAATVAVRSLLCQQIGNRMVQTWKAGSGEDFTCPHCGPSYSIKIARLPVRERDSADCLHCGKKWMSGTRLEQKTYTLLAS